MNELNSTALKPIDLALIKIDDRSSYRLLRTNKLLIASWLRSIENISTLLDSQEHVRYPNTFCGVFPPNICLQIQTIDAWRATSSSPVTPMANPSSYIWSALLSSQDAPFNGFSPLKASQKTSGPDLE